MGKDNQGSALKRVLNRSLGYTEGLISLYSHSKETKDLDGAYQTLLQAYDAIPDFDDAWGDIQSRYNDLTKKLKELETAQIVNAPKERKAHQLLIDNEVPVAVTLKADIEKKAGEEKLRLVGEADKLKPHPGASVDEKNALTVAIGLVKKGLAAGPSPAVLAQGRLDLAAAQSKATEIELAAKGRATRREKALKACALVADPRGANLGQLTRLQVARKLVTDNLPKPVITELQLATAEEALKALDKALKAIEVEITSRQAFELRLAQLKQLVQEAAEVVDGPTEVHLNQALTLATSTGSTATDAKGWNKAVGELNALATKVGQAKAYALKYNELSKLQDNYVKAAPGTEKVRLEKIITDAAGLAAGHDYAAAKLKLDAFEADPKVKEVAGFYKAMAEFRARVGSKLAQLKNPGLANRPANLKPDNELEAIKNLCIGKTAATDYQTAKLALATFETRIADSHAYVVRCTELEAFKNSPAFALLGVPDQGLVNTALNDAKLLADANPGNPTAALAKLNVPGLKADKVSKPAAASKLGKEAQELYNALLAAAPGSGPALHVKGLLDAAQVKLVAKEFGLAEGLFQGMLPVARAALGYAEKLKEAESACGAVALVGKPDVLKLAKDKALTLAFDEATALLGSGLSTLQEFIAYATRLADAKLIEASLDSTAVDALAELGEILKEAADEATKGQYVVALETLDALLRRPDLAGPGQEVTTYLDQRRKLDKPFHAAHGALTVVEAKALLQGLWDEAGTLASQKKYKEAALKLGVLSGHLGPAKAFAAERQGVQAVNKSLIDLETAGKSFFTATIKKTTLAGLITAADTAAKTADFGTALTKLKDFRAKARTLCDSVATDHDANERTTKIEPHSVVKHLQVDDTAKTIRVTTGVPKPKTGVASSFDDAESWVASREAALERGKSMAPYSLKDDNSTVPDGTTLVIPIEHNRPMGSAMVGVCESTVPKQGGPNKGELGGNMTYERAVKVTGYTRTTSVFKFDATAGAKGKWVLLTQYPYTDDWDAEQGCYTKPLPV